ncbi:Gx transporter family protein [Feifania hominis]|uniref:Gx transporter family protein n=1 Tax=Feifania hominis TaxID=2763660 RepID=A0A926HPB3_9FIRM|nr:Gx transporter family protein [Feifania hominis]MBC8535097.1 Gx transporter family protein [Feifania hominis]
MLQDNRRAFGGFTPVRRLVTTALLISMALVLAWLERLLPAELVAPIPGIKLGLPNIITLFALYHTDMRTALTVVFGRTLLAALLFGNPASFAFSLMGGLFALAAMAALRRGYGSVFTPLGVSVLGAAFHNIGQICAAAAVMRTAGVFSYLAVLLVSAVPTGLLTGLVFELVNERLSKIVLFGR